MAAPTLAFAGASSGRNSLARTAAQAPAVAAGPVPVMRIGKAVYERLHLCLSRSLYQDHKWSRKTALALAEQDWRRDVSLDTAPSEAATGTEQSALALKVAPGSAVLSTHPGRVGGLLGSIQATGLNAQQAATHKHQQGLLLLQQQQQRLAEQALQEQTPSGDQTLSFQGWERSMFELIDLWTETTDVADYCRLLDVLFYRATVVATLEARRETGGVLADPTSPTAQQMRSPGAVKGPQASANELGNRASRELSDHGRRRDDAPPDWMSVIERNASGGHASAGEPAWLVDEKRSSRELRQQQRGARRALREQRRAARKARRDATASPAHRRAYTGRGASPVSLTSASARPAAAVADDRRSPLVRWSTLW